MSFATINRPPPPTIFSRKLRGRKHGLDLPSATVIQFLSFTEHPIFPEFGFDQEPTDTTPYVSVGDTIYILPDDAIASEWQQGKYVYKIRATNNEWGTFEGWLGEWAFELNLS